jgi:hypothetical protein
MKDFQLDIAADHPLAAGRILAALMVPDSALGSSMFSEVSSDYQLGIGAAFGPVSGESFRGMI